MKKNTIRDYSNTINYSNNKTMTKERQLLIDRLDVRFKQNDIFDYKKIMQQLKVDKDTAIDILSELLKDNIIAPAKEGFFIYI